MKRLSLQFSALLTALFLFAFSCQDHYVPEEPEPETPAEAPVVQTLPLTVENVNNNLYRYKINVEKLGNIKISGYGIVFSAEFNSNAPFTKMPTLADNKVTFPMSNGTGEKSKLDAAPPGGYKTMYYRAYVTYGVNSVAYGNVMEFSPIAQTMSKIEVKNLSLDPSQIVSVADLEIIEVGTKPIEEYGIVYSYNLTNGGAINDVPTMNDNKITLQVAATTGIKAVIFPNLAYYHMYCRSYVKYTDGQLVYGSDIKYN